jgi:predicted small metal-binding protein
MCDKTATPQRKQNNLDHELRELREHRKIKTWPQFIYEYGPCLLRVLATKLNKATRKKAISMTSKESQKELCCRDVGVDCDFVARGKDEKEILAKAAEHAKRAHNMEEIPKELMEKVRKAIHVVA